ncbi:MAG: 4-vinyl reductase [Myxococcota bacterium]
MSQFEFDAKTNVAMLGGQSMVFHCHHYNTALQRAVEGGLGAAAPDVLTVAAQESARLQLSALASKGSGPQERLAHADKLFAELGFGRLDFSEAGARGGTVKVSNSHYAMGWVSKYGERDTPTCHFVSGFIGGALAVAHNLAPERIVVTETRCLATGHPACRFKVEVL